MIINACKYCTRCGLTRPEVDFYRSKSSSDGRQSYCKYCKTEVARSPEAVEYMREYSKVYYRTEHGKAVRTGAQKKYYEKAVASEKGRSEIKARRAKHFRKASDAISDYYVKNTIAAHSKIGFCEIPNTLVELKRIQLQIHRYLKEKK